MYTLTNKYVLRGWERLPYAVVNIQTGSAIFVSKEEFNLLSRCDGDTQFSPQEEKRVQHFIDKGIIRCANQGIQEYQKYQKYQNRYIQQAHWAITNRCNYKCKHCFISAPHYHKNDISLNDCHIIVDNIADCGIYQLSITGGEPFLRNDFMDILQYAQKRRLIVSDIYTNASMVSDYILNEIKIMGYNPIFHVSHDGIGTHDWMRGIPNVNEKTEQAIKRLKHHDYKVKISCSLYKDNLHFITKNITYFTDLGVDEVGFGLISATGGWKNKSEKYGIKIETLLQKIIEVVPFLVTQKHNTITDIAGFIKLSPNCASFSIPIEKKPLDYSTLLSWVGCETMRKSLYINPEGKLLGCEMLTGSSEHKNMPCIFEQSLKCILSDGSTYMDYIDQRLEKILDNDAKCLGCSFFSICHGGCRANAINSQKKEDPIACMYYNGGYYQKILDLMRELNIPKSQI